MPELKGSKTHDNLKEAFAGESQANRRYLYFAQKADIEVTTLFLDCSGQELERRYNETRRRHPFSSDARTLTEAIEYERALLADVRALGDVKLSANWMAPAGRSLPPSAPAPAGNEVTSAGRSSTAQCQKPPRPGASGSNIVTA